VSKRRAAEHDQLKLDDSTVDSHVTSLDRAREESSKTVVVHSFVLFF
jgi:hypothetical protein